MRECRVFWPRSAVFAALACCVLLFTSASQAASKRGAGRTVASSPLLQELDFLESHPAYGYAVPVIGQGGIPAAALEAADFKPLPMIDGFSARIGARRLREIIASGGLRGLTIDSVVGATADENLAGPSTIAERNPFLAATGADQAARLGYDGSGVAVAVFDSGIAPHPDLADGGRIRFSVDFTSGEPVFPAANGDEYGHGTHVAGIIAGDGRLSGGRHRGVAPGVDLIDVKVVGADGLGRTSNLIMAIDWVTERRRQLGVRVANFSVSRPATEAHFEDPLCAAVRAMVASGIVVVASAGNLGKFGDYPEIWASITSPGIDPSVITVYPLNTKGTATHDDDMATTYGSRGPAFQTHAFKPDLSAPGNRVPSLRASGARLGDLRPQDGPDYLEMSGASMAAPFVSGAAALLVQAHPGIDPRLAKLALLASAIPLELPHRLQQGNGILNVYGAVRIAEMMRDGESPDWRAVQWTLDDRVMLPSNTFVWNNRLTGNPLFRGFAGPAGRSSAAAVPRRPAPGDRAGSDINFRSEGVLLSDVITWTEGVLLSDVITWTEGVLLSDVITWTEGVLLSDVITWTEGVLMSDVITWTEGVLMSDVIAWSERLADDGTWSGDPGD